MSSADIYRDIILDYYRHPRNFGSLESPDITAKDSNPLCGDIIEIQIKLGDQKSIHDIRFNGKGCAISQASVSMLTEMVKGKELDYVKQFSKERIFEALGNPELGPTRVKCALLGFKVLKMGVYAHMGAQLSSDEFEK